VHTIHVTTQQLRDIKNIADTWNGHNRWIPALDQYLWEEDIRPTDDAVPSFPSSYRFLAGGVDHIDVASGSITVHDRCLQTGSGTIDGTTKFIAR